ncbi:MAG: ACP S-malonyltransferase [Treponema sp.]|jgi:[acyl-carrier-protein] S-malonyltransferase|nr:ACP S-malonyltransferase [Treponema sp.]
MKNTNLIYLFPGQGAQYPGMALDFLEAGGGAGSGSVKRLFELASEICGKDMALLLRDSGAETLKRTDVSQPAVSLANLVAMSFLSERGYSPAACAGFSLGEYAALVCASVIRAEDCFRLVKARGEAMQRSADRLRRGAGAADSGGAADDNSPLGVTNGAGVSEGDNAPGMAAVIGLEPEKVEALVAEWNAGGLKDLYPANINSPKQMVVSGAAAALAEAAIRFKAAGARRCIRLQVAGPFHSPLIADAAEAFRPVLESVEFRDPLIPLYSNVTGRRVSSGAEAKKLALAQITGPVRWVDEEAAIAADRDLPADGKTCLETGPGSVLQGLWRDSGSGIPCYAAGTVEEIEKFIKGEA